MEYSEAPHEADTRGSSGRKVRVPPRANDQPQAPGSGAAVALELIGSASDVLLIGDASGDLARRLDERGSVVVCVVVGDANAEEARVFSTRVEEADLDTTPLHELLSGSSFDAVVFDRAIEHFRQPLRVLNDARRLLRPNGFLVALLPNARHGATRLALIKGAFPSHKLGALDYAHFRGFALEDIGDLFLRSGYCVERVEHVSLPLFGTDPFRFERSDFSKSIVDEIEASGDSEILQFIVRTTPLSEEAKERGMAKELHRSANELAVAKAAIGRKQTEAEALRTLLAEYLTHIASLEGRLNGSETSVSASLEAVLRESGESDVGNLVPFQRSDASALALGHLEAELRQAAERNAELEDLLADAGRQNLAVDGSASVARGEAQARVAELEADAATLRSRIVEMESQIGELKESHLSALDQLKDAQAGLDRRAALALELQARLEQESVVRASLEASLSDASSRIGVLEACNATANERVAELEGSEDARHQQSALLNAELDATAARERDLQKRIRELKDSHSSALAQLEDAQETLDTRSALALELQAHVDELQRDLKVERVNRAELKSTAAAGSLRIGQLESLLTRAEAQLNESFALVEQQASENSQLQSELNETRMRAEEESAGRAGLEESLSVASSRIGLLEACNATATDRVAELEEAEAAARQQTALLNAELDATAARERDLQTQIGAIASRVAEVEEAERFARHQYEMLKTEFDTARAEIDEAGEHEAELQSLNGSLAARIAMLEESELVALQLRDAAKTELDIAQTHSRALEVGMSEIRSELTDRISELEESGRGAQQRYEITRSELEIAKAGALALEGRLHELRSELDVMSVRSAELEQAEQDMRQARDAALNDLGEARARIESIGKRAHAVQSVLEAAHAREMQLEARNAETVARIADLEGSLREENELNSQLHAIVADQRARFRDLEDTALRALDENEVNTRQLEDAWFRVYRELEEVRAQASRIKAELSDRNVAAERALDEADRALQAERREHDRTRAENVRTRDALAAELAVLKVRVAQAELLRSDFERKLSDSSIYAETLARQVAARQQQVETSAERALYAEAEFDRTRAAMQAELDAAREAALAQGTAHAIEDERQQSEIEATRKAALAERIVMRDYANEIQTRNDARARDLEALIAHLSRESAEARQQLEKLARETDELREEHIRQVAELQRHVSAANAHGEEMRELLIGAERRLLDQAEDTIADMQAESAQLVLLIDTVQSSHFWKLKRWLGRLLRRNLQ